MCLLYYKEVWCMIANARASKDAKGDFEMKDEKVPDSHSCSLQP